jgi:hypothetical protein
MRRRSDGRDREVYTTVSAWARDEIFLNRECERIP